MEKIKEDMSLDIEEVNIENEVIKEAVEVEEDNSNPERNIISEETVSATEWVNLPNGDCIGDETPEMKISKNGYYNQPGKNFVNKKTGEGFYSGLIVKATKEEKGEFILEGVVNDKVSAIRLSSWELVYKMDTLAKYCKKNNSTLAGQIVKFKRVKEGQKNAGINWELICTSLKIKIIEKDLKIVKL